MINRFLRRLSVRQRIIGMVAMLSALLVLAVPLQVLVQARSYTGLQTTTETLSDVERLVLQASARVAASEAYLLRYLGASGIEGPSDAGASEALREVNEALLRLDEARARLPNEETAALQALRRELGDYQLVIGQVQGAREAGQSEETQRLVAIVLVAGADLRNQIDDLVSANRARLEVANTTLRRSVVRTTMALLGADLVLVVIAVVSAIVVSRSITRPVEELRIGAEQLGQGNLDLVIPVEGEDDLSFLARVFNDMAARLARSYASLEQRVADRTRDVARRSRYMQAIIDVSRGTADILDVEAVIQRSVEVIRDRFRLYYVGLFLVDEQREVIELRAGTGEAGRKMLARGHQLAFGQGMIGWSVTNGQARVSLEADEDLMRFANPDLPDTKSEAAIPLRVRGRAIGAVTVQDDQPAAFDEEVVDLLQVMADLLATTIENARLYSEAQDALATARQAYGQMSREGWLRLLQDRPTGYRAAGRGSVEAVAGPWRDGLREAWETGRMVRSDRSVSVPVQARGEALGAVQLEKTTSAWTEREVTLVQTVVEQLGLALESARLYEDTQQSAGRERIARQITDRMRTTLDWDDLMQTAVQEIGQAVQASRVFVQWLPPQVTDEEATGLLTRGRQVAGLDASEPTSDTTASVAGSAGPGSFEIGDV